MPTSPATSSPPPTGSTTSGRTPSELGSYGLLLDAAELRDVLARLDAVLRPYLAVTRADAPDDARVVHVTLQAFPRAARTP